MSKILIADDNEQNLYLARFLLEQAGHDIDETRDGQQAVNATRQSEYDLVLMDIQMPVLDGLRATQLIKQDKPDLKIIALTAKAMAGDRADILAAGCDGYITKPIEPENFKDKVNQFLPSRETQA